MAGHSNMATASASVASPVRVVAPLVSLHHVDMRTVPAAPAGYLTRVPPPAIPELTGVSEAMFARLKATAAHNLQAPRNPFPIPESAAPLTPTLLTGFSGMTDSGTIAPYFGTGAQPSDMGLGASPFYVMQGVSTSFAVYNTAGKLQTGWPKTFQQFFGIPNPGACTPHNSPYTADPRVIYDSTSQRFIAAAFEAEGAYINSCPFRSYLWLAVSATPDPTKSWHIYSFNLGTGGLVSDFPQLGVNSNGIYFGANMFNTSQYYQYAEIFGIDKTLAVNGSPVTMHGFSQLADNNGVLVDTVQPVQTIGNDPGVEYFVNSYNINSGDYLCSAGCNGAIVWAFAGVTGTPTLTKAHAPTQNYFLAPNANQPGCVRCIDTNDTRISATPVFRNGNIVFSLNTGVYNGTTVVPGVLSEVIKPTLGGKTVTGATSVSQRLTSYSGSQAAMYGAPMPDAAGNIFLVFDTMGGRLDPSIAYRRNLEAPLMMKQGATYTQDNRWGDYSAASYDGTYIWLAGEYSPNYDWSTWIGKTR